MTHVRRVSCFVIYRYHLTLSLSNKVNQCTRAVFARAREEACRVDCCKSYRDAEPEYLPFADGLYAGTFA